MDPKWIPAVVTGLVALLGWAVNYGSFQQRLNNTAEMAAKTDRDLDQHKREIWPIVRKNETDLAVLGSRFDNPKGRGAHV